VRRRGVQCARVPRALLRRPTPLLALSIRLLAALAVLVETLRGEEAQVCAATLRCN